MASLGCDKKSKPVSNMLRCETFASLPASKQSAIAEGADRTVGEVLKKLEQMRVTSSGL